MLQSFLPDEPVYPDALALDRRVKPCVMVVDDSAEQRRSVARTLRTEGFEVLEATSGKEATSLAAEARLDAVVLEVGLPDIDGYEVCRRLKASSVDMLPVLHLSSMGTSEQARVRALAAGADGYLTHPVDPNALRTAVSSLVRLKRQHSAWRAQVAATSLLAEALDALRDHIALIGPTGALIGVNTAWTRFAAANGCTDDRAGLGMNYFDVCDRAAGAGSKGAADAATGLRRVLAGDVGEFEMEYPCHSSTEQHWFRLTARRVFHPGPVAAILTHTDTTAEHLRSRSDARYRGFVETAHEGVLAMDTVGGITYANARSAALFGWSVEELEGRPFFDFLLPDFASATRTRYAGQWKNDAHGGVDLRVTRRDGTIIELLASESPIRDDAGEVVGVLAMLTDMTDRNAAQRSMSAALGTADLDRRRLEATLEAIPVGVWLADASGRLTHTNPAVDRIWGGVAPRVESVEEYGTYRASWPATGATIAANEWALARTLATGETINGEIIQIERFDGKRGFVLNSSAPIRDAAGRITGGVVINVDMTAQQAEIQERERLVASLERERAHLSEVFTQAPAFFAVVRGPRHVFERVNLAYRRLIGPREIVGRAVADAIPEVVDQGLITLLDRVRNTGEPFVGRQLAVHLERVPGEPLETRYADLVYQRLDDADGNHAVIALGVDVTEGVLAEARLRESESRLREQFAKLPVPTFLWELRGDDFVLLECNDAGTRTMPNYSPSSLGAPHRSIFPERADLNHLMRNSLRSNVVIRHTLEVGGSSMTAGRNLEFTIGPQQPDRVLVHVIDNTERVGLEAQLRQAQKMEAVGRLAGGVAHDFNNLLTVIGAHASFLLESLDSGDPQWEDAEAIHKAGVRAAGLTRQLLAFSRKQILKPRVIDLNATVSDTLQMLGRLLGEDIDIATVFASDLPQTVADPGQIEQVLVNLAVNARDAMPNGGHLSISTSVKLVAAASPGVHHAVPAGAYVTLEVRDTGTGMSPEVQARLFEPFFTTKDAGKGTGLGLATVYGIVKQSSGYITVLSTLGKGTSFSVMLPAMERAEEQEQLQQAERAVARGVETVLLVEDEPGIRVAAKRILQRLGYVVLEAGSGEAAVALSAAFDATIHLVISDAVMPGITGAEAVRRLQAQRPSLKALYMSGYTDDEVVRRGIVSSAVRFVQKPFTAADFGRAVREALQDNWEGRET